MDTELLNYVPNDDYLADRVILVTGAAGGLGAAIAKTYARFGATVILLDNKVPNLEAVYDEIVGAGHIEPIIHPLDLEGALASDYEKMVATIVEQLGSLDGVVINAAFFPSFTPFEQSEPEMWSKVSVINLQANYLLLRACLPALKQAKDPSILFSDHHSNKAYFGAFGVAKAGLAAMCDILAAENDIPESFIRINRIDPGPIRTGMRTFNFPGEDPDTMARPEALVAPYLYFMGEDAGKRTSESLSFERVAGDFVWAGEQQN